MSLTNEKLIREFDNPFTLVNYAIEKARILLRSGRELEGSAAREILTMIRDGEDLSKIEEMQPEEELVLEVEETPRS